MCPSGSFQMVLAPFCLVNGFVFKKKKIENVSRCQMRFQYVLEVGCERYCYCRRSRAARKDLSQGNELCDEDTKFDFIKRYPLACCVMCKRIRFPVTASYVKHCTGLSTCAHDAPTSWLERLTSRRSTLMVVAFGQFLVRYFMCL